MTSMKHELSENDRSFPWTAIKITQKLAWISQEKTIHFHCLWEKTC